MVINGSRRGLVSMSDGEGIPVELRIESEIIQVWLDHSGIHFLPVGRGITRGYLPWDIAIAMSLIPPDFQRPSAPPSGPTAP
jgi:hypothetical protein